MQLGTLLLIGASAGILGGALGIGGGLVMIPAMMFVFDDRLYGPNSFHLFKLASLATATMLSIPAVRQHVRAGAVVKSMVGPLVSFGLLGIVLGVSCSLAFTDERTLELKRLFGIFMLLAVAANLWQMWRRRNTAGFIEGARCPHTRRWRLIGLVVGMPAGCLSGLLGIGGGVWAVPSQTFILKIRLPNAIANSASMIIALAAGGCIAQSIAIAKMGGVTAWQGLWLALWLVPGAMLGAWFGARLTHRLPVHWLRLGFYLLLVIAGLRLSFAGT